MNKATSRLNKKSRATWSAESGTSTLYIAIGILITAIVLMGGTGAMKFANKAKVNNELQLLNSLKTNTMRYGAAVGAFRDPITGLDNGKVTLANLLNMGFFNNPTLSINTAGTTLYNQWGGTITVASNTLNTGDYGDSIVFTFNGVPQEQCVSIASKVDDIAEAVTVNGTPTKTSTTGTDMTVLQTQCAGGPKTNGVALNTINYTLLR